MKIEITPYKVTMTRYKVEIECPHCGRILAMQNIGWTKMACTCNEILDIPYREIGRRIEELEASD